MSDQGKPERQTRHEAILAEESALEREVESLEGLISRIVDAESKKDPGPQIKAPSPSLGKMLELMPELLSSLTERLHEAIQKLSEVLF